MRKWNELRALAGSLDLGEPGSARRPPRENVVALQKAVAAAITDEEFVLDCCELQLSSALRGWERPGAPAVPPPFGEVSGRGIIFKLSYWAPGAAALPHEHTSWTINAVFQSALITTLYDWDTAEKKKRLQERQVFFCTGGHTESIYADTIHRVANPTNRLAASIHIFNMDDRPVLEKRVGPIPGLVSTQCVPRWPAEKAAFDHAVAHWRQQLLLMHADVLAGYPSLRARGLLERVSTLGDPLVKFMVAMVMKRIDADRSATLLHELVAIAPEFQDRDALVTVRA